MGPSVRVLGESPLMLTCLRRGLLQLTASVATCGGGQAIMRYMFPGWAFSLLYGRLLPAPAGTALWDSSLRARPRDKAGRQMFRHTQVTQLDLT